jgi:hypothetical protein
MTGKNEKRRKAMASKCPKCHGEMVVRKITVEEFMQIIEKKIAPLVKQEELEKAKRRMYRRKKYGGEG